MELHLKAIGILLVILAVVHGVFPKYFNWQQELNKLSLINKQMMYVHTLFIALTVLLMGLLCVCSSNELANSHLGKHICLGFGIFWAVRLFIQFFGYSSILWKGKTFETIVHIIFVCLWAYLSFIFLSIAFS